MSPPKSFHLGPAHLKQPPPSPFSTIAPLFISFLAFVTIRNFTLLIHSLIYCLSLLLDQRLQMTGTTARSVLGRVIGTKCALNK